MIQMVGLGKMGRGVAARLLKQTPVAGFDKDPVRRKEAEIASIRVTTSLGELAKTSRAGQRIFWLSVPAGALIDEILNDAELGLTEGDVILESGNSNYKDSMRRAHLLQERGVEFLDVGISGGVHGVREGYCLMVGGEVSVYEKCLPYFQAVAAANGVKRVGPAGSGHYVKMVHNAIEYGMLQVLGEGFFLMKEAPFSLGLSEIADLWMHGSVVRGWLLELSRQALEDKNFDKIADIVGGGETGMWAVEEALARRVPAPLITAALLERFSSHLGENFSHKIIAALRQQFGGHEVTTK